MSDWIVIRTPFDKPNKPDIIEILAEVPLDWKKYLRRVANKTKKAGRYLAANLLYNEGEAFYPKTTAKNYHQTEKESSD